MAGLSRSLFSSPRLLGGFPAGRFSRRFYGPLDRIPVHAAAIFGARSHEPDLIAAQIAPGNRRRDISGIERSRDLLEFLLERELALRSFPAALDAGGHDPQIGGAVRIATELDGLVRLPVSHPEGVRDDAGSGLEGQDRRAELEVQVRKQEEGDQGGGSQIAAEYGGF